MYLGIAAMIAALLSFAAAVFYWHAICKWIGGVRARLGTLLFGTATKHCMNQSEEEEEL